MARVIAGIYEIENQIGAGGGGIVYLGRHIRLNKRIVLKADKRSLNTKPEILRREVDMLKGLSHTYIPQVYDFVQEDGVVYTVMDFIEGESLDQILRRGEKLPQPQAIRWACQLLEALDYLHSQPPYGILHGDIKPANIMVRPNGDICLIDYNIALALGEDGAVRAGFSRGYASPEHYGSEYDGRGEAQAGQKQKAAESRESFPLPEKTKSLETGEEREAIEPTEELKMWTRPKTAEPTEALGRSDIPESTGFTEVLETIALPEETDPTENLETIGLSESEILSQPVESTELLESEILSQPVDPTEMLETIALPEGYCATEQLESELLPEPVEATELLESEILSQLMDPTEMLETIALPEGINDTETLETVALPEQVDLTEGLKTQELSEFPDPTEMLETIALPEPLEATRELEGSESGEGIEKPETLPISELQGSPAESRSNGNFGKITGTRNEKEKREEAEKSKKGQALTGSVSGSTGSPLGVMLDVRSDIYSLGATLYHLLSGQRPPQDAREVESLGPESCSPQIARILQRAMAVSPDMRYQTAKEMLTAFRMLHKQDKRVLRRRRWGRISAALLSAMFLAGGASTFAGMKQMEQTQEALALAEYSANSLAEGKVSEAIALALQAIPEGTSLWDAPVTAQARKALTDALGVYDLSDSFQALDTVELPSAPFTIEVSPDGTCFAAVYSYEAAVFELESGRKLAELPVEASALSEVRFADKNRLVYAGEQGISLYDLETKKNLWSGEKATTLAVSGDGTVVAAVNRDEDHAVIYRMSDGEKLGECSFQGQHMEVAANDIFANPQDRIFSLNETGDLLAVSFAGGGLQIFDWKNPEEDLILFEENDETGYDHYEGGFWGKYFAFAGNSSHESLFGLVDTEEKIYVGGYDSKDPFFLKADGKGIYLANGNVLEKFEPDTRKETELAYTEDAKITGFAIGEDYILLTTDDGNYSFYDSGANLVLSEANPEASDFLGLTGKYGVLAGRNGPSVRLLKQESHEEALVASYDAHYIHDEARISGDKSTSMLFKYEDFCVFDREGQVVASVELPDSQYIYDQQFQRTGEDSWLEVIWYDGTVRKYSGTDGSLIGEEKREPPSKDLEEEFYTERYRILSPLHGVPEVYDRKTNKKLTVLEEDAYLTYVTQAEEYIITEYVTGAGERYGLLLDDKLQTLAYLPMLCDITEGMLVFDDGSGSLRQCRLYSLQELIALGESYLDNHSNPHAVFPASP